jgi:hypothetical protein
MPPATVVAMLPFPGRSLKPGVSEPEAIIAVQRRLNDLGCGPVVENGAFTKATTLAVKRFQARFTDVDGLPLKVDGIVGLLTWGALFGAPGDVFTGGTPLAMAATEVARTELGVLEDPPGSNRGPRIDEYLRLVGLNPEAGSFPWCAAFVFFCFQQAASRKRKRNPLVKTAGVLSHWNRAEANGARRIKAVEAAARPELVLPGHIFIMDFGGGAGHTGIVTGISRGKLVTIEGNTNDGGSREGVGVFARTGRTIGSINKGFLEYA